MPRLSIVIAGWNGAEYLERCLLSLQGQTDEREDQVIAVTNFEAGETARRFPKVLHIPMPPDATVPALRSAGIYRSSGEIVALAEDHCTFDECWCLELLKAYKLPYSAIGGPVENGGATRALDWAAYFYDYGKFMPPMRPGIVDSLSGNNVSFRRHVLDEVEASFRDGYFEPFTHGEVRKRGYELYLAPAVVVYHQKTYRLGRMLAHCYHLGRSYAAKRVLHAPAPRRAAMCVAAIALPALLTGRIVVRAIRRGRLITKLLQSFPYLVLLTSSWSFGEFAGYCAGEGRSGTEWR